MAEQKGEVAKGTPLQQCDAGSNWVMGPQTVTDSQFVACISCAAWGFVLNLVDGKERDLSANAIHVEASLRPFPAAGLCTRTQAAIPCDADS